MEHKHTSNEIRTKQVDGNTYVFDVIRKKYLLLTPEEKVRQSYVHYLINVCEVPKSRIRCEYQLTWNALIRRCDIVVFDLDVKPVLIVECKKEKQSISNKTLDQLARYNLKLNVQYLVATNLQETYTFKMNKESTEVEQIHHLPNYSEMCQLSE